MLTCVDSPINGYRLQDLKMFLCWDSTSESSVESVKQSLEMTKRTEVSNSAAKEFMYKS